MNFLSFVSKYTPKSFDEEEIIVFSGWIFTSEFHKSHPNANIDSILMFLKKHKTSDSVKSGFVKACIAYHKEPHNILYEELKDSLEKTIKYAKDVYNDEPF